MQDKFWGDPPREVLPTIHGHVFAGQGLDTGCYRYIPVPLDDDD